MSQTANHDLSRLLSLLHQSEQRIIDWQSALTACRALPPEHGGDGELAKAQWLETLLQSLQITDRKRLDAKDVRVSSGLRPNLLCRIPGQSQKTLWILSHLDVVGPGDLSAWKTDPWCVQRQGDLLFGRGVEDNQQGMVSSLLLAHALKTLDITPTLSLGLVFMADEECGNRFGLSHILKTRPELFSDQDYYLVPDFGQPKADLIEIAEKGTYWLKIETRGEQCHASTPHKGRNAFVAGSAMVLALHQQLPKLFPQTNPLFNPPTSTFVPSRHEANAQGINILPGRNVFYLDCRILPEIAPDDVLKAVEKLVQTISRDYGVETTVQIEHAHEASAMDAQHPHVQALQEAVQAVYGTKAKAGGVGGGTVAALLRQRGLPAMVWACLLDTCHSPNEHASLSAIQNDSCVFAHLLMQAHA
ncbi:MAG: M20 family metallo-hydrolase [Desulfovibrio sp.]|nr:M20 family metallo-hydrolase [Desulfovibrio sp.]